MVDIQQEVNVSKQDAMTYSLWNRSVREYPAMHYFGNPMHIQSLRAFKILTKHYREFQSKICIARMLSSCPIHIPTSNNPVRLHSLRVLPLPKLVRYFTSLFAQKIKIFYHLLSRMKDLKPIIDLAFVINTYMYLYIKQTSSDIKFLLLMHYRYG